MNKKEIKFLVAGEGEGNGNTSTAIVLWHTIFHKVSVAFYIMRYSSET